MSDVDVTTIAGPLLLGYLMNCGFQGVLCVQAYTYYIAFPNDKLIFKTLVYLVLALETTQTILTTRDAYDTFVAGPRNVVSLDDVRALWFSFPIISGLVGFIGQMFFAYRLKVLSKSWIPTTLVTLFALCGMVAAISTGAEAFIAGRLSKLYVSRNYITAGIWNGSSAVCDIIISVYMFYYLSRQIMYSSCPNVQARISRLIRLIVETGLLTAMMATVNLLFFVCFKGSSNFTDASVIVAKLYANTMLLILNNRITVLGGRNDLENRGQSKEGPRGGTFGNWRLNNCSSDQNEQSVDSGGSVMVLKDAWEDGTQK